MPESWNSPGLLKALGNSLKVAISVAIVSTALATIAAKAMTRYRMPGRSLAIGFILLPMVMPGIIMAVGLLVLTIAVGMPLSLWTIGISHVVVAVPFLMLVVMARFEGLRQEPRRVFARSWRERLDDFLAHNVPAHLARGGRMPAVVVHRLVRRVPVRLLPGRQSGDVAGLHVDAGSVPADTAHRTGARVPSSSWSPPSSSSPPKWLRRMGSKQTKIAAG